MTQSRPHTRTGPGRGTRRSPGARRASASSSKSSTTEVRPAGQPSKPSVPGAALVGRVRSVGITRRAVALVAVVLLLVLSYAQSLRVYVDQERDLAHARAEIAQREQRIAELSDELTRWQDPAFVEIQARERLGWVVPGETGFVVLGPDGLPIDGSNQIDRQRPDGIQPDADAWWARMWGSVRTADDPAPPPAENIDAPPDKKPR